MATDPTDTTFTINLEEDPEIAYFTWKVEAEDVASKAATVVEPTGLLTLIMKDRNATFAQNKGDYRNYQCKINIENYMKRWFNDRERGKLCFFLEVCGKGGLNFWVPSV